nr:immunoglobulin light chain junction region [Macaca mulatta]MOV82451.1 immunoglobulin light chain junction region [Macaca mulatta]
CQQVYTNPAF